MLYQLLKRYTGHFDGGIATNAPAYQFIDQIAYF